MCAACKKPFDDVHPYDFMNDWTCYEMGYKSAFNDPPSYRRCLKNHTWRQHVAESYSKAGQFWLNPHYRIEVEDDTRSMG